MALVDDLRRMQAADDRKRLDTRAVATSIVVGLMAAQMEELHPGSREKMLAQVKAMTEHLAAIGDLDPAVVEDVRAFAAVLLNASNT